MESIFYGLDCSIDGLVDVPGELDAETRRGRLLDEASGDVIVLELDVPMANVEPGIAGGGAAASKLAGRDCVGVSEEAAGLF